MKVPLRRALTLYALLHGLLSRLLRGRDERRHHNVVRADRRSTGGLQPFQMNTNSGGAGVRAGAVADGWIDAVNLVRVDGDRRDAHNGEGVGQVSAEAVRQTARSTTAHRLS